MKGIINLFFLTSIIIFSSPAFAHKLIPTDGTNIDINSALQIPDPVISWAMYEKLNGNTLFYKFDAQKQDRLYASIVIPKLDELEKFTPSLAFIAPSFTLEYIDELRDKTPKNNLPFSVPSGYDVFVFEYTGMIPSKEFYEPFGQITYWERQEIDLTIPADATYYLAVYDDNNQLGKLALAVGYIEDFSASDFMTVLPTAWFESRYFVDDYLTPVIVFVIIIAIVSGIIFLVYRKIKKIKKKK